MNALQSYQFHTHQLRVIPDDNGEPWFIAKDVFDILGYSNSRDMVNKLCRQAGVSKRYIPELSNTYTIIDEGNLYRLIIKSNKPESEVFESWVCDDVLPSLRKTGSYGIPRELQQQIHNLQTELLKKSPRMHDVLKLTRCGYSKKAQAKMLGCGETTVRKESKTLKECGYPTGEPGTQIDLFGGV